MAIDREKIESLCEVAVLNYGPSMLVPWYLVTSYAYYHLNESLVSDEFYDKLCHDLLDAMDSLEVDHFNMDLVDTASLRAGTGFNLKEEDYPSRVRSVAENMSSGAYP
jgi:NAD-dependent DNA ligase